MKAQNMYPIELGRNIPPAYIVTKWEDEPPIIPGRCIVSATIYLPASTRGYLHPEIRFPRVHIAGAKLSPSWGELCYVGQERYRRSRPQKCYGYSHTLAERNAREWARDELYPLLSLLMGRRALIAAYHQYFRGIR